MTTTTTTTRPTRVKRSFFDLWREYRAMILATMAHNLAADLAAGYDYFGASITRQRAEIADYAAQTRAKSDVLKPLDDRARERLCKKWLLSSGAIS